MGVSHSSGKRKQRERVSVSSVHLIFHFLFSTLPGEQICSVLTASSLGELQFCETSP